MEESSEMMDRIIGVILSNRIVCNVNSFVVIRAMKSKKERKSIK